MVDLNSLLQAVVNAEDNLKAAEAAVAEAQQRQEMAVQALKHEQGAFDAAIVSARALARPVSPETATCHECGQPADPGHACRRMDGAPGPMPVTTPGNSGFRGPMPPPGFAPEPNDDREDNTGE